MAPDDRREPEKREYSADGLDVTSYSGEERRPSKYPQEYWCDEGYEPEDDSAAERRRILENE